MQKEGGAGENAAPCGAEQVERSGGSASPLQSDRPTDWQISKASYFLLKQTALLFLER